MVDGISFRRVSTLCYNDFGELSQLFEALGFLRPKAKIAKVSASGLVHQHSMLLTVKHGIYLHTRSLGSFD